MCLVLVALEAAAAWPFILAANRDERHARAATRAAWWADPPHVLAGRDLQAGGSWLAVDLRGRVAAVTNIREAERRSAPRSRGSLVAEFVAGDAVAADYARATTSDSAQFGAFHLLVFDGRELHYTSNRAPTAKLGRGVHAYSNAPHGIEWPKVASARAGAARLLHASDPLEGWFELLAERGTGPAEDRHRHAHFLVGDGYGTRCSTVLLVDGAGQALFAERSFDAAGEVTTEVRESFALRRDP